MHTRLLFLLIFMPSIANAMADSIFSETPFVRKNNISISHTYLTSDYLLLGNHFGTQDYRNKGFPFGVAVSYRRNLDNRDQLGLTTSFERQKGDWQKPGITYTYKYGNTLWSHRVGDFDRRSFTIAVDYSHNYLQSRFFRMYMIVGFGITVNRIIEQYDLDYYNKQIRNGKNQPESMRTNNRNNHVNFYYSPLGLAVGGNFSWFLELGFGYKGVMNTGVTCKFR